MFGVCEEEGIKEYWMVFPKSQMVEVFVLDSSRYQRVGMLVFEDTIASTVLPELKIDLSEVFEKKHEI